MSNDLAWATGACFWFPGIALVIIGQGSGSDEAGISQQHGILCKYFIKKYIF